MFPRLGSFDTVTCTVGEARAGRLAELTDEDFMLGMDATPKMSAAQFVPAYQESVESQRTGEVPDVRDFVPESVASETWLY